MSELVQLNEELGQVLRGTRLELGISQAEVARRTNVSPATISAIEHARFDRISKEHLVNILTEFFKEGTIYQQENFGNPANLPSEIDLHDSVVESKYTSPRWLRELLKLNKVVVFVYVTGEEYPRRDFAAWMIEDVVDRMSKDPRISDDWIKGAKQMFYQDVKDLADRRTEYEGEQTIRKTLRYIHEHPNIQPSRKAEIFDMLSDILRQVSDLVLPDKDDLSEEEAEHSDSEETEQRSLTESEQRELQQCATDWLKMQAEDTEDR